MVALSRGFTHLDVFHTAPRRHLSPVCWTGWWQRNGTKRSTFIFELCSAFIFELLTHEVGKDMRNSVAQAAAEYVASRARRGDIRATTKKDWQAQLARFADAVGADRPVERLTVHHCTRWWDSLSCSPGTARNRLSVVRGFCRWLHVTGQNTRPLVTELRPPRVPRRVPRAMSGVELGELLENCTTSRQRAMVALMVHCGLRCGEVASMQYDDLDMHRQVVIVTGKGGHQRALPVPDEAVQLLRTYFSETAPRGGEPVFRRHDLPGVGLRPSSVGTEVGRLMRRAGVKGSPYDGVSAHALRRTCASDMLEQGANIRHVQQVLGHASIATTQLYLRAAEAHELRSVVEGRTYLAS